MESRKSPERLTFFSDAVVAIALTLLVLPLADKVPELIAEHRPALDAITENNWQITSFLITFFVISREWMVHHRLYAEIKAYNETLIRLNFLWLLTIALLPFPSELTGGYGDDRFAVLFYIGTILANSVFTTAMTVLVSRHPELTHDPAGISPRRLHGTIAASVGFVLAFLLSAFVPSVQYYSLLLLVVAGWAVRLWHWRDDARAKAAAR